MTKEDILLTKQIANVQIYIEHVIKSLRDFKFLNPHATISSEMVMKLDGIIIIACVIIKNNKMKADHYPIM